MGSVGLLDTDNEVVVIYPLFALSEHASYADPVQAELTVEMDTAANAKKAVRRTSSASCMRMGMRMACYSEFLCLCRGLRDLAKWHPGVFTLLPSPSSSKRQLLDIDIGPVWDDSCSGR